MNNFSLDLPINSVSFGQVSTAILRECFKRNLHPNVFPLQGHVDLSTQKQDEDFNKWLSFCIQNSQKNHCRKNTSIKLWHINGSLQSYSETDSRLITFHELDQLTETEINILKNQDKIYVTSTFTQKVFEMYGIESEYLPLGFDSHNFHNLSSRPKINGVTQWGLGGKFELRKSHPKILNLWAKKYGNQKEHRLNIAISNPFMKPEHVDGLINQALEGKKYWNINKIPYMATNAEYNYFLQSNDIFFALSGGEGRGLPEFHATALGAWPIALNAHAYKDFLNEDNAILIEPNGKRPAADGLFFSQDSIFNVGNFYDFSEEDFYVACEKALQKSSQGLNNNGLELQKINYSDTLNILLKDIK